MLKRYWVIIFLFVLIFKNCLSMQNTYLRVFTKKRGFVPEMCSLLTIYCVDLKLIDHILWVGIILTLKIKNWNLMMAFLLNFYQLMGVVENVVMQICQKYEKVFSYKGLNQLEIKYFHSSLWTSSRNYSLKRINLISKPKHF